MNSSANPPEAPLFSEGGVQTRVPPPADPFAAFLDLMVVVEALCPRWPERGTFFDGGRMLL
jgi:hypothetical protein